MPGLVLRMVIVELATKHLHTQQRKDDDKQKEQQQQTGDRAHTVEQ